jgi:hypothetical protein
MSQHSLSRVIGFADPWPVFNFAPRERKPPGMKLAPGGEDPLFAPPLFLRVGNVCLPLGMNEGVKFNPRGQSFPPSANFPTTVQVYHQGKNLTPKV